MDQAQYQLVLMCWAVVHLTIGCWVHLQSHTLAANHAYYQECPPFDPQTQSLFYLYQ